MLTIYLLFLILLFAKIVSTRKNRNQQKKQFSQLNETSNDFNTGNSSNVSAMENEAFQQQPNGQQEDLERFVDSEIQKEVIEKNMEDKLEEQSTTLSRLSKIACTTRLWQQWIK